MENIKKGLKCVTSHRMFLRIWRIRRKGT